MKKHISSILIATSFWILNPVVNYAQHYSVHELDSLETLAQTCDTLGLKAIGKLVSYHYYSTGNRALHRYYIDKEFECADNLKWHKKKTLAEYHRMAFHLYSEKPDSTIWAADQLLAHIKDDTTTYALRKRVQAHYVKGDHYFSNEDNVEKGFFYFQEARDMALEHGFYELYLFYTNDLNSYYNAEGAYEKSFELAEETLRNVPDPNIESNHKLFTNSRLKYVKNFWSEIEFERAKAKIKLPDADSTDYALAHQLGLRQLAIEKADNAKHNMEALYVEMIHSLSEYLPLDTLLSYGQMAININLKNNQNSAYLYTYHGCNLVKAGKHSTAKPILLKAIELSKQREGLYNLLQENYNALVQIHLASNEPTKAKIAFKEYKLYSDSSYTRKSRTAVDAVETKYILSQQIAENKIVTQRSEQLSERLKLFTTLGILLFLLALSAFAFYLLKRKSARKLREMMDTKNKIFAILSHDLRGPISALNNLSTKIKYLINSNDLERLDKMTSQIDVRMHGLNENLNNVLLWAISESNLVNLNPEGVALYREAENILALYSIVHIDKKIINTIIRNLISNATKFSKKGGQIEIQLGTDKTCGLHTLKIKDNGLGLNDDQQTTDLKKGKTGSGIGLKICNELASIAGITLNIVPNPDGGAIGIVKIPMAA